MGAGAYSIQLELVHFRTSALHYAEAERHPRIYVEQSAVPDFDWVGLESDFECWTQPNVPMSAQEQKIIRARLVQWCADNGIKIHIGPPARDNERRA